VRAIVFLLIIVLVYFIARFTLNRIIEIREKQRQEALKKETPEQEEQPQEMVRCAQCGVHLPQAEAYYDGKDTFCSEGHMNQYHQEHNQDK